MNDDPQVTCPSCGARNPSGARFCKHCGTPFAAAAPTPAAAAPTPAASPAPAPAFPPSAPTPLAEAPSAPMPVAAEAGTPTPEAMPAATTPGMPGRIFSAPEPAPAPPTVDEPVSTIPAFTPPAPPVAPVAPVAPIADAQATTPMPPMTPVGTAGAGPLASDAPTLPGGYPAPSAAPHLRADAPTDPNFHLPPPDASDYPAQPHAPTNFPIVATPDGPPAALLAGVAGMAGMANYNSAPPPPAPAKKRSRAKVIAIISAILVVAIIAAGGLGIYFYLNAHTEADAANELPGNTFAFASLDLLALAKNHPEYSGSSILSTQKQVNAQQLFQQTTGLDFTSDVLPWLNRDIAVAGYQYGSETSPDSSQSSPEVAAVVLVQSRDDDAARAAMSKAAKYQADKNGLTLTTTTYSSVVLSTLSNDAGPAVTLGASNGWAFITTGKVDAAKLIVDRLNGKGDTLAKNADFVRATKNLSNDRFATTFVSLKGIQALAGASGSVPFIATYPLAVGDMLWTSVGARLQLTFPSAQPTNFGTLSGDTTSLAHLVPATAMVYDGYANPGGDIAAINTLGGSTGDLAQQFIGIPSTDPALQQPGAFAELQGQLDSTTGTPGTPTSVFLLKVSDPIAAQALLQEVATSEGFKVKPVKMTGTSMVAYAFYASTPGNFLGSDYGYDPTTFEDLKPPYVAGYAGYVNGSVAVTSSLDTLTSIASTASGATPSLGDSSSFQQLVAQAPSDAAGTAYVNLSALASFGSIVGLPPTSTGSSSGTVGGMLITQQLDANKLQFTMDEQINK